MVSSASSALSRLMTTTCVQGREVRDDDECSGLFESLCSVVVDDHHLCAGKEGRYESLFCALYFRILMTTTCVQVSKEGAQGKLVHNSVLSNSYSFSK